MRVEHITSRTNPLCTHVRKLGGPPAYRKSSGEFLCDSPKLLGEILLWQPGWLHTVICTHAEQLPALAPEVRVVEVPEEVMRSISPAQTPQGVLALCAMPGTSPPDRLTGRRYVVLDGVQDPGNVGTILRTADAFGAEGLFLLPGCADPFGPKTVRASMGAVFRCPIWQTTPQELQALLEGSGIPLYGAALLPDTQDIRRVDCSRAAMAVGSEGRGLSRELLTLCDKTVQIPMGERCESLNAAAAAAVLLWEMARNDGT